MSNISNMSTMSNLSIISNMSHMSHMLDMPHMSDMSEMLQMLQMSDLSIICATYVASQLSVHSIKYNYKRQYEFFNTISKVLFSQCIKLVFL